MGDVDELNSVLGVLASKLSDDQRQIIRDVQQDLFDIGGEISLGQSIIKPEKVEALEARITVFNEGLEPLKEFVLPGGNEAGALCHLARTVCRRLERNMVSLGRERDLNPKTLAYINRLSDFLFVFARALNDEVEIVWQSDRIIKNE